MPAPPPTHRRRGLSLTGGLSLVSVVCVIVLVSLPRLHEFALHENARDAHTTVYVLTRALRELPGAGPDLPLAALLEEGHLRHSLSDLEELEDGALLRRHGYLFRLVPWPQAEAVEEPLPDELVVRPVEAGVAPPPPPCAVLAWPWEPGQTGTHAILGACDGRVWVKEGASRLCGPDADVSELEGLAGWRRVR